MEDAVTTVTETVIEGDIEAPFGFQAYGEPVALGRVIRWLQEQGEKIPVEHRNTAECHLVAAGGDVEISITYRRPETAEEREARVSGERRWLCHRHAQEAEDLKRLIAKHPDLAREVLSGLLGL